jgi:hypothetical protein
MVVSSGLILLRYGSVLLFLIGLSQVYVLGYYKTMSFFKKVVIGFIWIRLFYAFYIRNLFLVFYCLRMFVITGYRLNVFTKLEDYLSVRQMEYFKIVKFAVMVILLLSVVRCGLGLWWLKEFNVGTLGSYRRYDRAGFAIFKTFFNIRNNSLVSTKPVPMVDGIPDYSKIFKKPAPVPRYSIRYNHKFWYQESRWNVSDKIKYMERRKYGGRVKPMYRYWCVGEARVKVGAYFNFIAITCEGGWNSWLYTNVFVGWLFLNMSIAEWVILGQSIYLKMSYNGHGSWAIFREIRRKLEFLPRSKMEGEDLIAITEMDKIHAQNGGIYSNLDEFKKHIVYFNRGLYGDFQVYAADWFVILPHRALRLKVEEVHSQLATPIKNCLSRLALLENYIRQNSMKKEFYQFDMEYGRGNIGIARNSVILLTDGKEYLKVTNGGK